MIKDKKYKKLVVIDKLAISVNIENYVFNNGEISKTLKLKKENKNILKKLKYKYKWYSKNILGFKVIYNKEQSATILYDSLSTPNKNNSLLVFKNHTFYTSFLGFHKEIKNSNIQNIIIKELDIALDFNTLDIVKEQIPKTYLKYCTNEIYLANNNKFYQDTPKGSYYIGKNRFVNIYNKTEQLKIVDKQYIFDFYEANGFNKDKGVSRLELRLSKYNENLTNAIIFNKLSSTRYLSSITSHVLKEKLIFVYYDDVNSSRRTRKKLLNVDFENNTYKIIYSKKKFTEKSNIKTVRTEIKKMVFNWNYYSKLKTSCIFNKIIKDKIKYFKLEDWYDGFISSNDYTKEFNDYIKKNINFTE